MTETKRNRKGQGDRMVDRICAYAPCGKAFQVRAVYVKRGGGRFCSVRCGASAPKQPPADIWRP